MGLLGYVVVLSFPGGSTVRNPPAMKETQGDTGSIPGSRRSPGGGHGNPLQYSCLENPIDSGPWLATVHGVAGSDKTETTEQTHMHGSFISSF